MSKIQVDTITDRAGNNVTLVADIVTGEKLAAPSGSSMVGYLPAGTGAVATTVQSKLRESVSVRDFGAVGDGTDETVKIQKAINSAIAQRKILYFPAAVPASAYRITSPLVFSSPVKIVGDGIKGTVIQAFDFFSGQFILDFNFASGTNYFAGISDITITSNNGLPNAVRLNNASYTSLNNVYIRDCYSGIVLSGDVCFSNKFENLVARVSRYGVYFKDFDGGGQFLFDHCTFQGEHGFHLDANSGTTQLSFVACNFESCIVHSVAILGAVQGLLFSGCRTENLQGTIEFLLTPAAGKNVTGLSVSGCYFTTNTLAAVLIYLGGVGGYVKGFQISGNHVQYGGGSNFVTLNGDGDSGVISGNYFQQPTTKPTNVKRSSVVIFSNRNSNGPCAESWGAEDWAVESGNWTPTVSSAAGVTTRTAFTATYYKVGRTVTLNFSVTLDTDALVGTSQLTFAGLPFAPANSFHPAFFNGTQYSNGDYGTGGAAGHTTLAPSGEIFFLNRTMDISSRTGMKWFFSAIYQTA